MLTRHAHNRRSRNRLLRGRSARSGGGGAPLTLRQQIGAVLGVEPQVFADARDLTVGDGNPVSTWGDWSVDTGNPTLDADGWAGALPAVDIDVSNYFSETTDAPNYAIATPHVWVVSGVFVSFASNRYALALEHAVDGNPRRFCGLTSANNARVQTRNDAGTLENDDGGAVAMATPIHYGMVYDGTAVWAATLSGSGPATVLNAAPHGPGGTATYNILTLGRGRTAGGIDGKYAATSLTRCSAGAATLANLQAVINLHNSAYPVA